MMIKIEGLHNETGQWITIQDDIPEGDFDDALDQVQQLARCCASVIILWGVSVKTEHFSAFRATSQ